MRCRVVCFLSLLGLGLGQAAAQDVPPPPAAPIAPKTNPDGQPAAPRVAMAERAQDQGFTYAQRAEIEEIVHRAVMLAPPAATASYQSAAPMMLPSAQSGTTLGQPQSVAVVEPAGPIRRAFGHFGDKMSRAGRPRTRVMQLAPAAIATTPGPVSIPATYAAPQR